jgi:hypothetical protein
MGAGVAGVGGTTGGTTGGAGSVVGVTAGPDGDSPGINSGALVLGSTRGEAIVSVGGVWA